MVRDQRPALVFVIVVVGHDPAAAVDQAEHRIQGRVQTPGVDFRHEHACRVELVVVDVAGMVDAAVDDHRSAHLWAVSMLSLGSLSSTSFTVSTRNPTRFE